MHFMVQPVGRDQVGSASNIDPRPQDRPHEAAFAARSCLTHAKRGVFVPFDDNSCVARQMQVPKHMTTREAREKQDRDRGKLAAIGGFRGHFRFTVLQEVVPVQ